MARPASVAARERADTYATRVVLIEFLRMMQMQNPSTIDAPRAAIAAHGAPLRPDDTASFDPDIREAAEMILSAAEHDPARTESHNPPPRR